MGFLKKVLKVILIILAVPVIYLLVSLVLTSITINESQKDGEGDKIVFLNTNGVHLDIIIPITELSDNVIEGLDIKGAKYMAFGWGDENFYLNTPKWSDLTFKNAFSAMFLNGTSLLHLTKYSQVQSKWVKLRLNEQQLLNLNGYLLKTFKLNEEGSKVLLIGKGYDFNDDFYLANGSYSCFKTCNSWANSALKTSGIKSCYWTPFDFGLINKHND